MKNFETKFDPTAIAEFDTGAHRSSGSGKGRYDLIPIKPNRRVAIKYEQGAEVYGPRNWEKGMPFSRLVDSAKRHIDQFIEGDPSEDHLAAAVWNLFAIMHFQEYRPDLNDLPVYPVQIEPEPLMPSTITVSGLPPKEFPYWNYPDPIVKLKGKQDNISETFPDGVKETEYANTINGGGIVYAE